MLSVSLSDYAPLDTSYSNLRIYLANLGLTRSTADRQKKLLELSA